MSGKQHRFSPRTMIKTIILDFDGVVVESADLKTEAFREAFQGYPDVVDSIIDYHLTNYNLSRFAKFKYIYEHFLELPYDKAREREITGRFSRIIFQKVVECPFVSGAKAFLESFFGRVPLYVASGTPQSEMERIVEKRDLQRYFKRVWGAPPGTKADFLRKALQAENARPEEAVYVGDMIADSQVAQETGVTFVGRQNTESFKGLNIPVFPDLFGVKQWLVARMD